jgi:hypothetical protein
MPRKKKQVAATTKNNEGKVENLESRPRGHIIRFPDPEAELRAVMVLGGVGLPYCGIPDDQDGVQYGLMNKHIEALKREEIPFEVVS